MDFDDLRVVLDDTPHTTPERGRQLYDFVLDSEVEDILELGFGHGTGSCYLAAALDERDSAGRLYAIDNQSALGRRPSIHYLLQESGLADYVQPVFAATSYTWELQRLIEEQTVPGDDRCEPLFDFCFVDGAHTWDTDGFAFFLVHKLLRPGGWILFDDLDWHYGASRTLSEEKWVQELPEEQREAPQIRRVYDLLVRQHPDYTDLVVEGDWGWARKRLLPAGSLAHDIWEPPRLEPVLGRMTRK